MMKVRDDQVVMSTGSGTREDPYIPESNVNIQDQSSPTLILPLVRLKSTTTLVSGVTMDTYTATVSSSTGIVIGDHIRIIDSVADRYYFATVNLVVGQVLTLDTPIDFAYSAGATVTISSTNLNVNGSITPVHFHLRTGVPSIPSSLDITRMIIVAETSGAVDLNKFGDLARLSRGIIFRKYDEFGMVKRNIFNVRSNAGLVNLAYDFTVYSASNPSQGRNGFAWRLTFAGQEKMGVVLRVGQGGQLGMIVQDNLTSLISLKVVVEGHAVV